MKTFAASEWLGVRGEQRSTDLVLSHFATALDLHAPAALTDAAGRFIHANDKFCALSGYSREELLGQNPRVLNSGHHPKQFFADLWSTITAGRSWHGEIKNRAKNGSEFWVDTTVYPLPDGHANGKPGRYLILQTDITHRRRQEAALRDHEVLFSSINANLLGSAICRVKFRPSGQLECAYVSPNVRSLIGFDVSDIQACPDLIFARAIPEDAPRVRATLRQAIESGAFAELTFRTLHADGQVRWIHYRGREIECLPDGTRIRDGLATDITSLKQAEEEVRRLSESLEQHVAERTGELRQSEARLREAQRVGHMGSWQLDHADGRLTWSDEIFRIFEINPSEFGSSYQTFLDAVHPDDRASVDQAFANSVRDHLPYEVVHRLRMPDGRVKHVQERGETHYDPSDRPVRSFGTVLDITERKQAEHAIQSSLEILRSVVENAPVRVFWKDRELRYLGCNSWFARDAGYASPSDIVGRTDFDLGWKDQAEAYRADDRAVMDGGVAKLGYEEPQTAPDGSLIWLRTSKVPLHDDRGQISGILGIYEDITGRKESEQALREAHDRLTTLFEGARDAILIADDETGRILDANAAASQLLGIGKQEILLRRLTDLHPPDKAAASLEQLRGQAGHGSRVVDAEILRADGRRVSVEITASLGTLPSGRRVIQGFYRDVDARKQLEAQIMRNQRLESIGTLAGGVAHDLNNALAPILLVTEMLRTQYPTEEEMVEIVATSARRAAEMVKQLLTFARGVEGERQNLQTVHLLREIEKIVRSTFPKNIVLRTTFARNLRTVLGDATQLHQVLLNLCVNARDAMPHGGTLAIEAENVDLDPATAGGMPGAAAGPHVVWRIKDTGIGIPSENLDRIFDPFFTTKTPEMGTGLGLSTVLGIVRSHGGFLQVRSAPQQGTTFAVCLPSATPSNPDALPADQQPDFRGHGESVLFVDDEATVRQAAHNVLQRLNFKPILACDGVEGLARAAEHAKELRAVITDQHMPHMDGLNFVRVLRRFLPEVPVAVASGRLDPSSIEEFHVLGVRTRLDKPFSEPELARLLRELLAR